MIKELVRTRYLPSTEVAKSIHTEMANLFFGEFLEESSDDEASEGEPGKLQFLPSYNYNYAFFISLTNFLVSMYVIMTQNLVKTD